MTGAILTIKGTGDSFEVFVTPEGFILVLVSLLLVLLLLLSVVMLFRPFAR